MKKLLASLLCAAMVVSMASCGSGQDNENSNGGGNEGGAANIRLALQAEDPALPLMQSWAEENADVVKLDIETAAGNDLRTKLTTDMASDNMPDIFYYWTRSSLRPFIDNNMLLDISKYFEKSTKVKREDFSATDFLAVNLDGGETAYGIPCGGSTQLLACNKDLFDQYGLSYPTTYEELLEVGEVFKENGIIPIACGSAHGDIGYFLWSSILYQYASVEEVNQMISEPDAFASCDGAIKASEYISEMAEKGMFPADTVASGDFDGTLALFNAEQAGMLVATCWKISGIEVENTDFITYPKFPGAKNDPAAFTTGGANNGIYIFRESFEDASKTDGIVAVMDQYCSDEVMSAKAENLSNSKNLPEQPAFMSEPTMEKFLTAGESLDLHMAMWALMPNVDSREVYMDLMDSLYARQLTPSEYLSQVQEAVNEDLAD
jgi:raffinose/stachyose/melibiose transport system substrate-binding protein